MNEQSLPTLYVFTISHYCEKARWALDYLGLNYQQVVIAPGTHVKIAKKLGLKRGSVPYLNTGDEVIQGSGKIIDWAQQQSTNLKSLSSDNTQVLEIEKRLDEKLGVHIRRWFYSEAIIETPERVKPIFMHQLPLLEKLKLNLTWPVIRNLMKKRMDLGFDQGIESMNIVKNEIDWIETMISDSSSYLVGNQLTRADITAASLLAPLVRPQQYYCSKLMDFPPRVKQESTLLEKRLFWSWTNEKFAKFRNS